MTFFFASLANFSANFAVKSFLPQSAPGSLQRTQSKTEQPALPSHIGETFLIIYI